MKNPWSEAQSVRTLRTFQAMPLRFKILEASLILAPLCCAWAAYLDVPEQIQSKVPLATMDIALGGAYGLMCALVISIYFRGPLAEKRGIQPAIVGKTPQHFDGMRTVFFVLLIAIGAMWVFEVWLNVDGWLHYPTHYRGPISGPTLSSLANFILMLFIYTRFRFVSSQLE